MVCLCVPVVPSACHFRATTGERSCGRRLSGVSISVPLPDDLAHRLEAEAARRGLTTEELAAEVIRDHLGASEARAARR